MGDGDLEDFWEEERRVKWFSRLYENFAKRNNGSDPEVTVLVQFLQTTRHEGEFSAARALVQTDLTRSNQSDQTPLV